MLCRGHANLQTEVDSQHLAAVSRVYIDPSFRVPLQESSLCSQTSFSACFLHAFYAFKRAPTSIQRVAFAKADTAWASSLPLLSHLQKRTNPNVSKQEKQEAWSRFKAVCRYAFPILGVTSSALWDLRQPQRQVPKYSPTFEVCQKPTKPPSRRGVLINIPLSCICCTMCLYKYLDVFCVFIRGVMDAPKCVIVNSFMFTGN